MKWLIGRRRSILLAIMLAPLGLWGVLLLIAPTDWARRRLTDELAETTGQRVQIGRVSLGMTGQFQVRDVSMATEATPDDPWLSLDSASLDLNLFQVLWGCCQPAEVDVVGVKLRVQRAEDGTLEIADLLRHKPKRLQFEANTDSSTIQPTVNLNIKDAAVTIIDGTSGSRFDVSEVQGRTVWTPRSVSVENLTGRLNGGTFEFAARCDRSTRHPAYEAEARLRAVSLGAGMNGLSYLIPVVSRANDTLDGKVHLRLAFRGEGFERTQFKKSLEGHGTLAIDPLNLDGSYVLREVEALHLLPRVDRMGSVQSNFKIADGKILSDDLTIKVGGVPLVLTGWTDFEGKLEYMAHPKLTQQRLPKAARSFLTELDLKVEDFAGLRIEGTLEQVRVSLGRGGGGVADRSLKDKQKVDEIRNRLIDRILR